MYHANKKKKEYRGGGMASDMLMKMMQGGMLKMPGGGMMPKYPGGGMMPRKYDNGGEVKSDSTKVVPLDLFGMEAVLEAKRKQDAEMQNLSQRDKLRKAFGIPEGGADLDIFGIDAVLDAREAAGLSRNPLDDLKPIGDKGKELLEKLRVYFGISDEPKEMPGGGMMPRKYDAGGMMTDPTRKAERRKALLNELRIAQDPMTNYGSEEARDKDVASIQARLKDLG